MKAWLDWSFALFMIAVAIGLPLLIFLHGGGVSDVAVAP